MSLVIGTRGSDLALWQARWVAAQLGGEAAGVRLEIVRTEGDRVPDASLVDAGGQGVFTRDIELALLGRRIDVAVHSLKDLPTTAPDGLVVAAVPARADVADVLLVRPQVLADDGALPVAHGARVGTASPRRQALLAWLRPDLVTGAFRGNVPTRVEKCVRGDVDAVVLARAGVARLGLDVAPLVAFDLDPATWVPAPAQGALGIQTRADDAATRERVAALGHADAATAAALERGLLALLGAGCHAALGAWCRHEDRGFRFFAGALGPDGAWRAIETAGTEEARLVSDAAALLEAAPPALAPPRCWRTAAPWR